jgi:hypothetical protein
MTETAVIDAASAYAHTGEMRSSAYRRDDLSVDPVSTQAMERLFNPFQLGRQIADLGFRVRARGHWGGANGRRVLRLANTMLAAMSPVTMVSARAFRIAAYKL